MERQQTSYERLQSFNFLTRWLHTFRYQSILRVVETFSASRDVNLPIRILDIGCGTAHLFSLLDPLYQIDYVGYEIYPDFVHAATTRYSARSNFRLISDSITKASISPGSFDLIVALETLEHIPEHDVVRLIEAIALAKPKLFVCSVPVEIGPSILLKNIGAWLFRYPRYREYTWAQTLDATFYRLDRIPLHKVGHMGFDWRWLAQTIRHNLDIIEFKRFPFGLLPSAVSSSVFLVAKPRVE